MKKVRILAKGRTGDTLLVKNLRRGLLSPTPKKVLVDVTNGVSFRARAPDGAIVMERVENIGPDDTGRLIDLTP